MRRWRRPGGRRFGGRGSAACCVDVGSCGERRHGDHDPDACGRCGRGQSNCSGTTTAPCAHGLSVPVRAATCRSVLRDVLPDGCRNVLGRSDDREPGEDLRGRDETAQKLLHALQVRRWPRIAHGCQPRTTVQPRRACRRGPSNNRVLAGSAAPRRQLLRATFEAVRGECRRRSGRPRVQPPGPTRRGLGESQDRAENSSAG